MRVTNIHRTDEWFKVLETTEHSQTAVMTLEAGAASGDRAEAHPNSDQTFLVIDGEVIGEIGSEKVILLAGDSVIVPAGVKYRFQNAGDKRAVTFSVYAPPAYPE